MFGFLPSCEADVSSTSMTSSILGSSLSEFADSSVFVSLTKKVGGLGLGGWCFFFIPKLKLRDIPFPPGSEISLLVVSLARPFISPRDTEFEERFGSTVLSLNLTAFVDGTTTSSEWRR
jgi:hypothetical protein